jgi:YidC/Oxa1 family membrane protein insertase
MEKRVLIAIVLSFLVLYFYQVYFVKPAPSDGRPRPAVQGQQGQEAQQVPPPAAPVPSAPAAPVGAAPAFAPAAKTLIGEQTERDIVVDTAAVRAVFTNRGGEIKSWRLKRYLADTPRPVEPASSTVQQLFNYIGRQFQVKQKETQELVPAALPEGQARPFRLAVDDPAVSRLLGSALFAVTSGATGTIDGTTEPVTLSFAYQDESGLQVQKTFKLEPSSYVIRFTAKITTGGKDLNPTVLWGPGIGDALMATPNRYLQRPEAIFYRTGVTRVAANRLASQPSVEGEMRFAGVDDHYFLAVVLPDKGARVDYQAVTMPSTAEGSTSPTELVSYSTRFPAPPSDARFFFGPKDFDVLAAVDRELVRTINFGILSWLAVPLLGVLKWINRFIGNYGWSIVLLTVVINALMFPLRHKSMVSMRRMQEIQPQIKAIQEKYGKLKTTDPERQKMNTEMMALYKEKGVNPASGCVPMLLPMVVMIAFYEFLSQAIELRGAPFALWIQDLSLHDPLYVTPVLQGVTMVWQQRVTPSSADPTQQKMMMLMPLVFTFMFLWAPSGLVVFWFLSNLLGIGQQYVTNRIVGPPKPALARPPAEHQLKSAGTGRTRGAAKGSRPEGRRGV